MNEGYSKRPLGKKLGFKEGYKIALYNTPKHYFDILHFWPDGMEVLEELLPESVDFMHLFCTEMAELERTLALYLTALKKNGSLWVSWPKGASTIETDLNRELIRSFLLDTTGLVDIKVAAIDADWSGLKFTYRLKNR